MNKYFTKRQIEESKARLNRIIKTYNSIYGTSISLFLTEEKIEKIKVDNMAIELLLKIGEKNNQ